MLTIAMVQTFNDCFCMLIKNMNRSVVASTDDPPSLQSRCHMKGHVRADGVLEGLLLVQGSRYCGYFIAIDPVNKVRNQNRFLISRKGRVSTAAMSTCDLVHYWS